MKWRTHPGAGVLTVHNGLVLMVLHYRGGKYRWELPSGFVHAGESFETAAAREALEETSLPVDVGRLFCTVVMDVPEESFRGINLYFCAEVLSSDIPKFVRGDKENEPIKEAAYIDLASIKSRDLHPVDRKILTRWSQDPNQKAFYFRMVF